MNRRQEIENKIQRNLEELVELRIQLNETPKFDVGTLSWKDILNTSAKFGAFGNIEIAKMIAKQCSYPYYSWNHRILKELKVAMYLIREVTTSSFMGTWGKETKREEKILGYFDGSLDAVKEYCSNYGNEKDTEITYLELKELK
jgi:hypothetical protein